MTLLKHGFTFCLWGWIFVLLLLALDFSLQHKIIMPFFYFLRQYGNENDILQRDIIPGTAVILTLGSNSAPTLDTIWCRCSGSVLCIGAMIFRKFIYCFMMAWTIAWVMPNVRKMCSSVLHQLLLALESTVVMRWEVKTQRARPGECCLSMIPYLLEIISSVTFAHVI